MIPEENLASCPVCGDEFDSSREWLWEHAQNTHYVEPEEFDTWLHLAQQAEEEATAAAIRGDNGRTTNGRKDGASGA